ncbi:hypothetical protein ACP275_04G129900 [Erythranthe tilingii]
MAIISKSIFLCFALICSWASVGYSQVAAGSLDCVQKLMPCQPYLKGSSPPPPGCCLPLRDIIAKDSKCLCAVFTNSALLKSLNITQNDGLNLAKSCGANADTSLCKTGAAVPSGSPSPPGAPSTTNNSSTPSPPHKNAATALSGRVGGYLSTTAAILGFIISAF